MERVLLIGGAMLVVGIALVAVWVIITSIPENGGGPGVRLEKARRAATKPKKGD